MNLNKNEKRIAGVMGGAFLMWLIYGGLILTAMVLGVIWLAQHVL